MLRPTTQRIIALLEEKSGYPVQVIEEPGLPVFASMRIARDPLPAHILKLKSLTPPPVDYTTCLQCSLVLRLFACEPEQRYLISAAPEGFRAIGALLHAPNGLVERFGIPPEKANSLRDQLLQGLVLHLHSIAIGLRVSQTLTIDYPDLLDLEAEHVEREYRQNLGSLSDEYRQVFPEKVFSAMHKISAAYALFWAGRMERPELVNPYHLFGFDQGGERLLQIFESIPSTPEHDCELVDQWADYLGIRGWYSWLPYIAP